MGPSLFSESLGNAVEQSGQEAYFASCDFCFVHFLNQEQVSFWKLLKLETEFGPTLFTCFYFHPYAKDYAIQKI